MLESEREMKAAAAADEGCGAPIWSATTNWIPAAGGCLADVVFYDTSDDPEIEQSPKPLVLLKPEGDDSPPCEVTSKSRVFLQIFFFAFLDLINNCYISSLNVDISLLVRQST